MTGARQMREAAYLGGMRTVLIALTFVAPTVLLQAAASDFPVIDVEAACREMYGASGNQTLTACIRREQLSYDVSRYAWARLPSASQEKCVASADKERLPRGYGAHVYYTTLGSCLSAELDAERLRRDAVAPPRFRY